MNGVADEGASSSNGNGEPSRKARSYSVAYLGPDGTYGQQAARQFASNHEYLTDQEIEWIPCPTIAAAYETESDFTVLPLENTIFGPVTETLDCLIQGLDQSASRAELEDHPTARVEMINGQGDRKGKRRQQTIIGSLDLPIQHCLVVKKGTKMEGIQWVSSHEQALGQSTNFLNKYLPRAKLVPTASTALAAQYLLSADPSEEVGSAICSRSVVDLQPDLLEVLYEGTQDRKDNFTRFLLLTSFDREIVYRKYISSRPAVNGNDHGSESGRIEQHIKSSTFYVLSSAGQLSNLISNGHGNAAHHRKTISTIHTRPHTSRNSKQPMDKRLYPTAIFLEIDDELGLAERDHEGREDGIVVLGFYHRR